MAATFPPTVSLTSFSCLSTQAAPACGAAAAQTTLPLTCLIVPLALHPAPPFCRRCPRLPPAIATGTSTLAALYRSRSRLPRWQHVRSCLTCVSPLPPHLKPHARTLLTRATVSANAAPHVCQRQQQQASSSPPQSEMPFSLHCRAGAGLTIITAANSLYFNCLGNMVSSAAATLPLLLPLPLHFS